LLTSCSRSFIAVISAPRRPFSQTVSRGELTPSLSSFGQRHDVVEFFENAERARTWRVASPPQTWRPLADDAVGRRSDRRTRARPTPMTLARLPIPLRMTAAAPRRRVTRLNQDHVGVGHAEDFERRAPTPAISSGSSRRT
jgi:hypothetical protein